MYSFQYDVRSLEQFRPEKVRQLLNRIMISQGVTTLSEPKGMGQRQEIAGDARNAYSMRDIQTESSSLKPWRA